MHKKKILIIGGAGFIGSNLCKRLVKEKTNLVYCLDNYFTGSKSNHIDDVNYINGSSVDINDKISFLPDLIFHLGEYSRVEQSFEDIEKVWEFNQQGTFKVLEFCRKNKIKLIYSGSSTKFTNNIRPGSLSPYSWFKTANTELIINYGDWFNLDYTIVYFYNVYGNNEIKEGKYATLISLFKNQFERNEALTVVSPGTQKRNFTHIDDIIEALILISEKGHGDGYGIGNDENYSILEIAKQFKRPIKMIPERKGNRMGSLLVNQKTKDLGWQPKHSVIDHIKKFIDNKI